jgi:hypothetical protein
MQHHRVRIWFGFCSPSGGFHFHDFCSTPFRCFPLSLQTSFVANKNSAAFGVKRLMRGKKKQNIKRFGNALDKAATTTTTEALIYL